MKRTFSLTSTSLRLIAMGTMLLDHAWATVVSGGNWMTYAGRIAFPIFAFLTAQGYHHTRDFRKYCLRLLLFGLLTEIPFNLMISGSPVFPFHQNVMFTLLLGLLAIHQTEQLRSRPGTTKTLAAGAKLVLIFLLGIITFPDYGLMGVLTVVGFHLVRNHPWEKPLQAALMVAIHIFGYKGWTIPLAGGRIEFPVQGFAVFALIPIWLYNGRKGKGGKVFQYAGYLFYPAHMLLLYLISTL